MNKLKVKLSLTIDVDNEEYEDAVYQKGAANVDINDYNKKYVSAELFIDDRKIGGYFDYTSLLVNSYDNRSYIDKEEGFLTPQFSSAFYPLSCSCGEPGCNGIDEGVATKFTKETMIWHITDESTKQSFGTDKLVFDRKEYDLVVRSIWQYLHNIAIEDPDLSLETSLKVSEYLCNQKMNNSLYYIEIY